MEIKRESFVGSWNVYAEASISQLELQLNGRYLHTLWNGAQSHWGTWSIQQDSGFDILRLDLQGAQPEIYNGPNGPIKVQWPQVEAWVIGQIFPNQAAISIFGGLLLRRSPVSPPSYAANAIVAQASPPNKAAPAQVPDVAPPATGQTAPHPQRPAPPPTPMLRMAPAPLPLPIPNTQFPNILKQWADLHEATLTSVLQANLARSNAAHSFAKQFIAYAGS